MHTTMLYSLPGGAISGDIELINNYSEFTSIKSYDIAAAGGSITLPSYFVGFKNKTSGEITGNQDKGTIEYEVTGLGSSSVTISWITNVTFTKYDSTANKISFTASANNSANQRLCYLKLKNSESSYHILLLLNGNGGISLGGSDGITIKFNNGNGYSFVVTYMDNIKIDDATPVLNSTLYVCTTSHTITGSGSFTINVSSSTGGLTIRSMTYESSDDTIVSKVVTGNNLTLNLDTLNKGITITVYLSTSL